MGTGIYRLQVAGRPGTNRPRLEAARSRGLGLFRQTGRTALILGGGVAIHIGVGF